LFFIYFLGNLFIDLLFLGYFKINVVVKAK